VEHGKERKKKTAPVRAKKFSDHRENQEASFMSNDENGMEAGPLAKVIKKGGKDHR